MQQNDYKSGFPNDQASRDDHLGFKPYVEAVASFLSDDTTNPPLTLSIDGDWGSGKTSFLYQLQENLKCKQTAKFKPWKLTRLINNFLEKPIILETQNLKWEWLQNSRKSIYKFFNLLPFYSVQFSPWRYTENEALWAAFAIELERQLYLEAPFYSRFHYQISKIDYKKTIWNIFKFLFCPIAIWGLRHWQQFHLPDSIFAISIVSCFFLPSSKNLVKELEKTSKNSMDLKLKDFNKDRPDYVGKTPFLDQFHKDIQELVKKLAGKNKVYVLIDDLDRCSPNQSSELIQSINLLIADELKLFFILAVDNKKIAAGIAYKFKEFLPLIEGKIEILKFGYDYLDKFIQISFKLPTPKLENIDYFFSQLLYNTNDFKKLSTQLYKINENDPQNFTNEETLKLSKKPVKIDFQEFSKTETMQHISHMAGEFFQKNPRKLKKFLNLFKFYVFLGNEIQLFGKIEDGYYIEGSGINCPQLAKIIIINYKWPGRLEELKNYPELISYIDHSKLSDKNLSEIVKMGKTKLRGEIEYSILENYLKDLEFIDLIHYETFWSTQRLDLQNNWELTDLKFSNLLDITFFEQSFHDTEANLDLLSIKCRFCLGNIHKNNFGIFWNLEESIITDICMAHVKPCGKKADRYMSCTGPGMVENWDARYYHQYFLDKNFFDPSEKKYILQLIYSFINVRIHTVDNLIP